ncbi:MAG TPA: outer membrane protein [Pararhizobium sp.]|nr:outer membrane protein [Pararhizobium sp.]
MRKLVIALMASAFAVAAAGAANAADALKEAPAAPVPAKGTTPLYIWTGPYVGAFATYDWADVGALSGKDMKGAGGGAYAGYNWQFGNYVLGVEGDLGYSGADASIGGLKGEQGMFGSVRGRVGYAFNPFMLYATGGLAASNAKIDDGATSDSNTHIGWTAGAGAEAAINDSVTARIEYRYSDYGSKTYDLSTGPVSSGFDEQSVRAGIGIKF